MERPRRSAIALLALCVVALAIRLAMAGVGELWRDEALFLAVVDSPSWSAITQFLHFHEAHPPFFYFLERVWLSIFGNGDSSALALPIALGVLLVPIVYVVGRSIFTERVGLVAAALVAVSPPLAEHSAMVRPYSLLPILALVSGYTLWRGLVSGGVRVWIAHAVATLCMIYTHNWSWLVVGAGWVVALITIGVGVGRPRRAVLREWIVVQAAIVLCFLPWLPAFRYQSAHAGHMPNAVAGFSGFVVLIKSAVRTLLHATIFPGGDAYLLAAGKVLLVALIVMDVLRLRRQQTSPTLDRKIALMILLGIPFVAWIAAIVLSPRSNLIFERCVVMFAPSVFLVLAWWIIRPRPRAGTIVAVVFLVALVASYRIPLTALITTARSNAGALARTVAARTEPTDLVIVAPEWMSSSFNRYYTPRVEQIDFPHFGRQNATDFANIGERMADHRTFNRALSQIDSARSAGRRVWLIMDRLEEHELTPAIVAAADTINQFGYVGMVRTNQLRVDLIEKYGAPDTTAIPRARPTRFEHLRAYLFSPRPTVPTAIR